MNRQGLALAAWIAVLVVGCGTSGEPAQEVAAASVSIDGGSCRAAAHIRAGIGACDEALPPLVEREDRTIFVDLLVDPGDGLCTLKLVSHEVDAELGRLSAGRYELVVDADLNEKRVTFDVPPGC